MRVRVAVRLRSNDTSVSDTGSTFPVALAKLRTFELYECTGRAKERDVTFDARHDDFESIIERFLLTRDTERGVDSIFLVAEIDMYIDDVDPIKDSMGRWGSDLCLLTDDSEPLAAMYELCDEQMLEMVDEAGAALPHDWKRRMVALEQKHCPPPTVSDASDSRDPMPMEYSHYVLPAVSSQRCACGNHASAGGLCNACQRQVPPSSRGSPKRARSDETLMCV
jgi:hypothetical protein